MSRSKQFIPFYSKLAWLAFAASLAALTGCTNPADSARTDVASGVSAAPNPAGDNTTDKSAAGTNDSRPTNTETQNKAGTNFPSVGASGSAKETGSFPSADKGAENAPPAQGGTQPSVMPKDRNGIVGSPMASQIDSKATSMPAGENLDVAKYSYGERHKFKVDMESRLTAINRSVGSLEANPKKSVSSDSLQALKNKEQDVSKQLTTAENVPAAEWSTYKEKFRDEFMALEKSYREMSTTVQ